MDRIASFKTEVGSLSRGAVAAAVLTTFLASVLLVAGVAALFAWEPFAEPSRR